MKKLALLFVLLAGAGGAGSWWLSLRIQQGYRVLLAQLEAQPGIRVLESDYQPGWLSSRASTHLEIGGIPGATFQQILGSLGRRDVRPRVGLLSEHRIEHGLLPLLAWLRAGLTGQPLLLVAEGRIDLDEEAQAELRPLLGRWPAAALSARVGLSRTARWRIRAPAVSLRPRAGAAGAWLRGGRWQGLEAEGELSLRSGQAVGRIDAPGLELATPAGELRLAGLSSLFEGRLDPGHVIFLGAVTHHAALLAFWARPGDPIHPALPGPQPAPESSPQASDLVAPAVSPAPAEPVFALSEIIFESTSKLEQGALRLELDASLAQLRAGGIQMGPASARLVLRNLDAAGLDGLRASASGSDSSARRTALRSLAERGPVLELNPLSVETAAGVLEARGDLRVLSDAPARLLVGAKPIALLEGSAHLAAPGALLGQEQRRSFEQAGWLVGEGDRVRAALHLRGGVLRVNGREVPLPGVSSRSLAARMEPEESPEAPAAAPQGRIE